MFKHVSFLLITSLLCATYCSAYGADYTLLFTDKISDKHGTWKYFGGDEFPGATGMLSLDKRQRQRGAAAMRLDADFTGGGAYVCALTKVTNLKKEAKGIVFFARAENTQQITLRLTDSSGQTHQIPGFQVGKKWEMIKYDFSGLEKKHESWGGKADGKWNPPIIGISFLVGGNKISNTKIKKASLWIDDIALDVSKK